MTNESKFLNSARFVMEGSFDLSASAAVLNIAQPDGSTKTVRGENMSVSKAATGTFDVTVKMASSLDGKPIFQPVEVVEADAQIMAAAVATALGARIASVTVDSNGNLVIRVLTTASTGAAGDTTAAITVCFQVTIVTQRMGMPL